MNTYYDIVYEYLITDEIIIVKALLSVDGKHQAWTGGGVCKLVEEPEHSWKFTHADVCSYWPPAKGLAQLQQIL